MKLHCPRGHEVVVAFRPSTSELHCPEHGVALLTALQVKPRKPLRRVSKEREAEGRSSLKRGKGFQVHPEQRAKVRGLPCAFCGRVESEYVAIDPAHVLPRSLGGCSSPLCVIPLCRTAFGEGGCHRSFDLGHLDALATLLDKGYHEEIAHLTAVHRLSPLTVLERLSGQRWEPVERLAA